MGKKQKSSRTNHFKHLEGISITSNQQKKETIEHQKASITPSKKKSDSLNWRKNDVGTPFYHSLSFHYLPEFQKDHSKLKYSKNNIPSLTQICIHWIGVNLEIYLQTIENIINLPLEIRDEVFLKALQLKNIPTNYWEVFIHSQLRSLDLSKYSNELNDHCIEKFIFASIKPINSISDWEQINEHFGELSTGCPFLKSLNLTNCTSLTSFCIHKILKECHILTELNLSHCYQLKSLKLSSSYLQILDVSFNMCKLELDCPFLLQLKWAYAKIEESNLIQVLSNCRELEWLDLSGWRSSSVEILTFIFENCPRLKVLFLREANLTDRELNILLKGTLVQEIHLGENPKLSVEKVQNFIEHHVSLKKLNLSQCFSYNSHRDQIKALCQSFSIECII